MKSVETLPQVGLHRQRGRAGDSMSRRMAWSGWRRPLFAIAVGSTKTRNAALLTLALVSSFGGCGGEPASDETTGGASGHASSMHGDLVSVTAPTDVAVAAAGVAPVAATSSTSADPKVIYLVYADGKTPLPSTNYNACSGLAPKFDCTFGTSLLDCQQQIQAYLDRWYADFNVVFTLTRPSSGKLSRRLSRRAAAPRVQR